MILAFKSASLVAMTNEAAIRSQSPQFEEFMVPDDNVFLLHCFREQVEAELNAILTDEEFLDIMRVRGIPEDATDLVILPEGWVHPDRSRRKDWRLVNGEVVLQGN